MGAHEALPGALSCTASSSAPCCSDCSEVCPLPYGFVRFADTEVDYVPWPQ